MEGFIEHLEVNWKTQLSTLKYNIFILLLLLIVLVFKGFEKEWIIVALIAFLIDFLPALFLHVEYLRLDREKIVKIGKKELIYQQGIEPKREISYKEIRRITFYHSPARSRNSSYGFSSIERYYFIKILLRNGETFYFTSLMSKNLNKAIKSIQGVQFEEKVALFNNISRANN